jgi:glycosyltransferase involved in cell wall biosynthesis
MRILVISDVSVYMRGGVSTETRALVNGLVRRGHIVALASDSLLTNANPTIHVPIRLPIDSSLQSVIERALSTFNPDFVHVICMSSKGVFKLSNLLSKYSWALTIHSLPPYERKLNRWHNIEHLHYLGRAIRFAGNSLAWRWLLRRNLIPCVIVHSKFVADIAASYGAPTDRIELIPLSIEPLKQPPSNQATTSQEGDLLLVTVGGLAHTKGYHDVVKSLPALVNQFPRLRYQIIGEIRDETYVSYLWRLSRSLGVSDRICITSELDDDAMVDVLARADVYVQPSHEEGFCMAFAEAAARVPRLVGTSTGAIATMCEGDEGARVVPTKSSTAISSAILDLMTIQLPGTHIANRRTRFDIKFSYASYIAAHERLYESMFRKSL